VAPILDTLSAALLDHLVATSDVIPWEANPRFSDVEQGWRRAPRD